jgi:hypothetical protein
MSTGHRLTRRDTEPAVGRDIEAWCGAAKCNRLQEHTITAMVGMTVVQVRCKTCGGEHKYKTVREAADGAATKMAKSTQAAGDAPAKTRKVAAKPTGPTKAQITASNAAQIMWNRAVKERDRSAALPYAPTLQPAPGQLLEHKLFGLGVVESLTEGKAKVLFVDGSKLLVVGR